MSGKDPRNARIESMRTRAPDASRQRSRRALLLVLPCLLSSCAERRETSSQEPGGQEPPSATPAAEPSAPAAPAPQTLTIFAASSLRDAFEALAEDFRRTHAGVEITFNFAGSQELRAQIEHGAPAGVFASADRKHMDALIAQGLAQPAVPFARNHLVVVVPRGAATVKNLQDLPRARRIVIGGPEVPVGRLAREMLARATARWPGFEQQVMARVVSQELNVRQVLAKVALGEADAGIVYRTDAATSPDKVDAIAVPEDLDVVAEYPIAALAGAPEVAQAWIAHVRSPAGQQVLARFGFEPPGPAGSRAGSDAPGSEDRPAVP
jgi:molybdate transport system substrate-binding protein